MKSYDLDANEFDRLCAMYVTEQTKANAAQTFADGIKADIIRYVEHRGHVPTNAEASRRVEGADWCATVTTPSTVEIRDDIVTELELVLSKAKQAKLFPSLFSRRVEYSLVKGAEHVLPAAPLPKRLRERILTLYAQCFIPKKKTPSLRVEPIAVVRDREDKAAKKAAKKAGRK